MIGVFLLGLALLPPLTAGQAIPPHCDAAAFAKPRNVSYLGPARTMRVVSGIDFNYHLFGSAASGKPALVLIQGLGTTQYGWPLEALQELAKTRQVLIFDNPLVGLSADALASKRRLNLTIPFMAASTVELIAALNLPRKPDVLGLSMGGMVAQTIAVNHPSAVRAVVSVTSSFGGKHAPQPPGGIDALLKVLITDTGASDASLMFPLGFADPAICSFFADANSLWYAAIPGYLNAPGSGYGAGTIIPTPLAAFVSPEAKAEQAGAISAYFRGHGTLARLARTQHPLMWMGGAHDRLIPGATQALGHAGTPGSWLVMVPDAGHVVPYQHPTQWAKQVLRFLDNARPRCTHDRRFMHLCRSRPGGRVGH